MGRRHPKPIVSAEWFRLILAFLLFSMVVYLAVAPQQMLKVKAEIAFISFASLTIVIQLYVVFSLCCPFPYGIRPLIGLDAFCSVCWCAVIVLLAYWDRNVVYTPQEGDPDWWFECANAAKWEDTVTITAGGDYVTYINIVWCEVVVNGQQRLVGNSRALDQLHALIAVSTVSLLLFGAIISWMVWRGRKLGLIGDNRSGLEARGDAGSDTSSTWSR